jgi:hypothetical protein
MMSDFYSNSIEAYLRNPPRGLARSAYAVEINPWARRGDIEAALLFRGVIVSAYGNMETQMGELVIRCSRLEVYAKMKGSFPFSVPRRLAFLRAAFSHGPLMPYQKFAISFIDRFEASSNLRHQIAHARMQVMPDWGVTFHDIPSSKDEEIQLRSKQIAPVELEEWAWQAAKLSRLFQNLIGRLNNLDILPLL